MSKDEWICNECKGPVTFGQPLCEKCKKVKEEPVKFHDTEDRFVNAVLPKKQVDKIAKETARQVMLEIEAKESWKRNLGAETPMEPHSVTITRAGNGFIIKDNHSDTSYGEVIEEEDCIDDEKAETEAMVKLLYLIKELFGTFGNKYDKHKVYVLDLPGQDSEEFTEQMSEVVWYREDEEQKEKDRKECQCDKREKSEAKE